MTQQALYRKWRSRSFDEIIGQPHVIQTLQNALDMGRVAHAYIFSGPRGTGKTSTARILAKAVNCLAPEEKRPCDQCHICLSIANGSSMDLIEIDAASNTQVDKVRDVIVEKVNFAPTEARKKVYLIDEVHMLSNSAFNALLKTVEEPPPHAMFILATTEIHKIPATILSRCQRLDFRRIGVAETAEHLGWVLEQEGITADPEVLELVARQATGSMRDALSLLDQLLAHGGTHLTLAEARGALGLAATEAVQALVDYILAHDVGGALQLVNRLLDQGADPRQFLVDVLDQLRALLLTLAGGGRQLLNLPDEALLRLRVQKNYVDPAALIEMIRLFNQAGADLKLGLQPQLPLELAIIESVLTLQNRGAAAAPAPKGALADVEAAPARPKASAPRRALVEAVPDQPARGQREARQLEEEVEPYDPVDLNQQTVDDTSFPDEEFFAEPAEYADDLVAAPWVDEDEAPPSSAMDQPLPLWEQEGFIPPPPEIEPDPLPEPRRVIEQQIPTDSEDRPLSWWRDEWTNFVDFMNKQGDDERRAALRLKGQYCEPAAVDHQALTLGFAYSIHRDKIETPKERAVVERALRAFSGASLSVRTVIVPRTEPATPAKTKYEEASEDPVVREALRLGGRIVEVYLPDQG